MKNTIMLVVVLTIVCLISALSLALVNNVTVSRIAEEKHKTKLRAVLSALPRKQVHYDNDPGKDIIKIPEWTEKDGTPKEIYLGKRQGKVVGVAFTSVGEGYGGFITVMVGVDLNEKITGIEIVEDVETPGLGAKIESPELFKNQFKGKSAEGSENGELVVVKGRKAEKDWEIEALTGATISPRGVVQAVNEGLAKFRQFKDQIISK
jgi:electron transport complex protein RnfG